MDATQIIAEKRSTEWTYKGERGYMPMVGHLAEAAVVIHDDFRAGNIAPASANLDFVKACEARLSKGHRLAAIRADSASYQSDLFNYSENGIKELKIGFGMERMPCGQESANAAFFRIGVIAHNLFVLFKHSALGEGWQRHRIATVRWRLFQVPGRLIRHAGAWVLKVAATFAEDFADIRARGYATLHELAP